MNDTKPLRISFVPPKTIVLVGLMGCGKTSIGRRLASRLELEFADSDKEVEEAAGCQLKDVVDIFGEDTFRKCESKVISRLLAGPTHILATGGESFITEEIRNIIKENSISVWLKANIETLLVRVARRSDRPLLSNGDPKEILEKLIEERYDLYSQADIHVETFDEPTSTTIERVIHAISDFIGKKYPNYHVLRSI